MKKILVALALLIMVSFVGCDSANSSYTPSPETGDGITKVSVYNKLLKDKADKQPKSPIKDVEPIILSQEQSIEDTKTAHDKNLKDFRETLALRDDKIEDQKDEIDDIKSTWYYRWGERLDRWFNWVKWFVVGLSLTTIITSALSVSFPWANIIYRGICLPIITFGIYPIGRALRGLFNRKKK